MNALSLAWIAYCVLLQLCFSLHSGFDCVIVHALEYDIGDDVEPSMESGGRESPEFDVCGEMFHVSLYYTKWSGIYGGLQRNDLL